MSIRPLCGMSVQCPMVNRTVEYIWENKTLIGRVVVIAGDFCQTFSVVPMDKMADELNACPQNSTLWKPLNKLKLTSSM
jgi:PIF1 helicase.